jgi:predicted alpha/beta superfamily hydrolase
MKTAEGKPELELHAVGFDRFLAFLRDELVPSLSARYPVDLEARHTLVGDSSGGPFVLRALYDARSPCSRYICISPGFGSAPGSIVQAEADYAASHGDLDADVFVCCGATEPDGAAYALTRIGAGVIWTAEQFAIRNWPSARLGWEIMNHQDHASVTPRAVAAGLRFVHQIQPGVHDAELRRKLGELITALAAD